MTIPTAEHLELITAASTALSSLSTELLCRGTDTVSLTIGHDHRDLAAVIITAIISGGMERTEEVIVLMQAEAVTRGFPLEAVISSDRTKLQPGQHQIMFSCLLRRPKKVCQIRDAA